MGKDCPSGESVLVADSESNFARCSKTDSRLALPTRLQSPLPLACRALSDMLKSSGAMAGATLLSRLLGMVRVMIYARFMGDGPIASAFVYAFQIPNLFRRLLGEGALTAAFIPLFKNKEKTEGDKAMWHTANAVVSALVVISSLVIGVVMLGLSAGADVGGVRHSHGADDQAAASGVPVHAAGVPYGGVHGDAQLARLLFHPGDGCHAAQRGDDRHGAARRAALGGGLG